MTLKEKFENIEFSFPGDESVKIADEFAIGFAEWCENEGRFWVGLNTATEKLEIYKKEKGL